MKVSIRVFDKDEHTFLSMIIGQAAKRLNIDLTYTDANSAEVVFVKEDEPGASVFANACAKRPGPIAVVYGGSGYTWCLEKPASTKSLIILLPQICAKIPTAALFADTAAALPANTPSQPSALLPVKNGQAFLRQACRLTSEAAAWSSNLGGELQLFANPATGLIYFPENYAWRIRDLIKAALSNEHAQPRKIDSDELAHATVGMHAMPLEGFLWLAAQEAEPEPLNSIPGEILSRKFKLIRWPSFSRFEHSSLHIALTGKLMKQPLSIKELCSLADWPPAEVLKFYNSACMCELLQLEESATTAALAAGITRSSPPAREEKAGVFSRILRRFAG